MSDFKIVYKDNLSTEMTHLDSGNSKKDMFVREQQLDFLT